MNITEEWLKTQEKKGAVIERTEWTTGGVTYKTDGRTVLLDPLEIERTVAEVLANKYGKKVELIPRVVSPQNIQTPDYLIDGVRYDLKSPSGRGKDLFRDLIKKKRKQSPNFIFDVTNCPLSDEEIERQIRGIFSANNTKFVEKIVLMKNGEVIKVYKRK